MTHEAVVALAKQASFSIGKAGPSPSRLGRPGSCSREGGDARRVNPCFCVYLLERNAHCKKVSNAFVSDARRTYAGARFHAHASA